MILLKKILFTSLITILLSCENQRISYSISELWAIDNATMDNEFRMICENGGKPEYIYIYGIKGIVLCNDNIIIKQNDPYSIDDKFIVLDTSKCFYRTYDNKAMFNCNKENILFTKLDYHDNDNLEFLLKNHRNK